MSYVFHEFSEVLSYTDTHMPKVKQVRLVGTYLNCYNQTHMLQSYTEYKFQPVFTIKLDMASALFPQNGCAVQIFGIVKGSGTVLVLFWTDFEAEDDIIGYINCLRSARQHYGPIECWNPQMQLDDSDVDVDSDAEFEMALAALNISLPS